MSKAQKIIGFGDNREKNDFYATPEESTESLLRVASFRGDIYEPCCGQGHISKVLIKHGFNVFSSDLVDRGYGTPRIDFLMEKNRLNVAVTRAKTLAIIVGSDDLHQPEAKSIKNMEIQNFYISLIKHAS